MDIDFQELIGKLKTINQAELDAAHNDMLDRLTDWVTKKHPNIRLETVERNIAAFLRIQEYDIACAKCMSTETCPSLDGNRMNGKLGPDGVLNIWMEPCPHGYRTPKVQPEEAPKQKYREWEPKQ